MPHTQHRGWCLLPLLRAAPGALYQSPPQWYPPHALRRVSRAGSRPALAMFLSYKAALNCRRSVIRADSCGLQASLGLLAEDEELNAFLLREMLAGTRRERKSPHTS